MSNEIEEKIKQLLNYVKQDNSTVEETIKQFKKIFKRQYFVEIEDIDEAYYKFRSEKYYILNGNGIFFEIGTGDGDIFGSQHAHEGTDIVLCSRLSRCNDYKYGISLFYGDCKEKINIEKIKDYLFDIDLSEENILGNEDNNVYKTIDLTNFSKDILNNNKTIDIRYNQMKEQAESIHDNQVSYSNISPYGGLDVDIVTVEQLLYDSLKKFKSDEKFIKRAITLFYLDYPDFIKNEIKECTKALYIIDNKEKYLKQLELEEQEYKAKSELKVLLKDYKEILNNNNKVITQFLKNKLIDIKKDITINKEKEDQLIKEARNLFNKKYSIFKLFNKQKEIDKKRLVKLGYEVKNDIEIIDSEGEIAECDFKVAHDQELIENIKNALEIINQYENLKDETSRINLKYPFYNFTIWDEIYEDYNYDRKADNGPYASLSQLIEKKDYYFDQKRELEEMNQIIQENMNYFKDDIVVSINEAEETEEYES